MYKYLFLYLLFLPNLAFSQPIDEFKDYRMCGEVVRNSNGTIARRRDVLAEYQRLYPCPSTGRTYGACPGWALDHTIPLSCGGCDSVSNLSWMPRRAKSCNQPYCKDRYERDIFPGVAGSTSCRFKITK